MSRPIPLPRLEGEVSRQAHADLPPGTYEREIGREGFSGPAAHMYHAHPPTAWSSFEGPLRPRAFDTARLGAACASPWDAPLLLWNAHLRYRVWVAQGAMDHLVRNADGDELLFVHSGSAALFCDWGHLAIREGDYVVLPRGALWRLEAAGALRVLLIEATGSAYSLPERGLLGDHALFDPAVLDTPRIDEPFRAQQGERPWQVHVKARGQVSRIGFAFNPLDAVGWKGTLAPVRLNWRDIRPVVSPRYHLPPSAHATFAAGRFAISTFCPRPLETDPGALRLPFFHSNDDFDEVLFYHSGRFVSRDFASPGMLTFHPGGFAHGPHPKAFEAAQRSTSRETDEVAVMLDARDPLEVGPGADALEWKGYVDSLEGAGVKLASLRSGRDGMLVVVSRDLARCARVPRIARTLQGALDDWAAKAPRLERAAKRLESGELEGEPFDPARAAAPLPRAYQWADASAYVNHVELVRRARGAELPPTFWTDPLIYQGGSDGFAGPRDPIRARSEEHGIDFEAELAVVTDDVPMGTSAERAREHIRLLMLVNDVSLRALIPAELAKGFGFYQSKPQSAFSPVAVTPDELGAAWDGGRVHLPLRAERGGELFGAPDAGTDMTFDFPALIAHAAHTRELGAGTILGSGTVSNHDRSRGSCCIAERRMLETLEHGAPRTPFLRFGERVRIEMLDAAGASVFGAIEQRVERA